ncbi:MAG TPA: hypothetical protein O0X70_01270 [Methanocorpusculum sp.]|nr:hypothetical protein [Methanocorpusculum sp.]
MPDKQSLINWSRGCLISAMLCVFIGLLGKLYPFYAIAVVLLILSFVLFGFARKKEDT